MILAQRREIADAEAVDRAEVPQQQTGEQTHAVQSREPRRKQRRYAAQPHGRGQILARQRIARDPGHGHHDDRDRRDHLRLYRRLPDDQRSDDRHRVADRVWQAQPGLLQHDEREQHAQHLEQRRKGHVLLGLDDRQQQPCRDHLLVVHRHGDIHRRQKQRQQQRKPAQHAQRARDQKMLARVGVDLHELGKADRHDKADRQAVHEQPDAPLAEILGKAVGAFGVDHLRKRRARRVRQGLLELAGGEHRVDVERIETPCGLAHQIGRDHVLEIEERHACRRLAPQAALNRFETRRRQPAAQQSRVRAQRLDKSVLRALQRFFERRLADCAHVGRARFEAQCERLTVKYDRAAAVTEIRNHVVEPRALLHGIGVDPAAQQQRGEALVCQFVGARALGQRAQHQLADHVARYKSVKPADGDRLFLIKADRDAAVVEVAAALEELDHGFSLQRLRPARLLLRMHRRNICKNMMHGNYSVLYFQEGVQREPSL